MISIKSNISKGKYGEKLAREYIIGKGHRIIEENYKNKIGEIDIISIDKDILVFIEVKARTNRNYGYAYEAVNYKKQRKITNISLIYMKYKNIKNIQIRYDIIEVYLERDVYINHIEDAFSL